MKSTLAVFPIWVSMLCLLFEWVIGVVNVYVSASYAYDASPVMIEWMLHCQ